jgi:CheY-like chemotaxis protein
MATVLVADDNADTRLILGRVLRHAGHETYLAVNGVDALELSKQVRFDIVIMDVFMPEKDGLQTIIELRRDHPATRIIAISAGWNVGHLIVDGDDKRFCVLTAATELGANRTLEKPLDPDVVCQAVDALLHKSDAPARESLPASRQIPTDVIAFKRLPTADLRDLVEKLVAVLRGLGAEDQSEIALRLEAAVEELGKRHHGIGDWFGRIPD